MKRNTRKFRLALTSPMLVALVLSLGIVALPMAGTVWAQPNEVWVDDGFTEATVGWGLTHFAAIQLAIDAVAEGGMVSVAAGTYTEWQDNGYGKSAGIIIDKPLHLQGSGDDCIIRGKTGTTWYMSDCPILWVKADDIEIDHFRFDGATYTEAEPKGLRSYGIKSAWKVGSTDYAATNLNVHNNKFVYIGTAVTQDRAGGGSITLAYNTMVRETRSIWYKPAGATPGSYVDKTLGGGGFKFDYVAGGSVHDNTGIETPGVGIFLHGCDGGLTIGPNNVISAPGTTDPSDTGIHIQGCSNITIKGNTVSNFTAGEKEHYNNGTTGAGIRIITSNDNVTVEGNELHDNTVGVLVTGASGSPEIHFNNIEDNEEFGVLNCASWVGKDRTYTPASVEIDATYNFWGSGGTGANKGKPGEGGNNDVSSYVDYDPWLTAPYAPTTPMASFTIDHTKIDFKKKVDDDKVRVQGKLELDLVNGDGVDISDDVTVTVGPLSETITMVEKGKEGEKWEYKRPKGGTGDIKHMTIDWKNGKFDIRMDKADLTGVTNPVTISVQIGDDAGSESILMREHKHHWDYKAEKSKKTIAVETEPFAATDPLKVVAYPNPIRDVDTATFQARGTLASQVEEIRVQIYDLSGQLVWEDAAPGSKLDWHTNSLSGDYLANGIYLYRVQVRIGGNWINQDIGKIAVLR